MKEDIIRQEKTNEELIQASDRVIDLLTDFNPAEKFKIISSLFDSLKDTIKEEGIGIIEVSKRKKGEN